MAIKKKTRAKVARKARTESDIKAMMSKYQTAPFGSPLATSEKFDKSMFRAIFKFKKEYKKVCEKHGINPSVTIKFNIIDVIEKEICE